MDTLWIQINLRSFINQMDASTSFITPFWSKCRFFCNVVGLWQRYKYTVDASGVIIWYLNCSPSLISPPRLAPRYADRKAGEGLLFYSMNDSLLKIPPAVSVPVNKRGHQQYQQRMSLTGQNNDIPSHYTEAKQTAPALQTIEDFLTCSQSYSFLHSPLLRKHRVSQSFMCKRGRIADC